ncbi:MAG: putative periplasmic protein [Paenibacillus sp.]|nr:putative periplasmic protein [Paenibacillus sp.]
MKSKKSLGVVLVASAMMMFTAACGSSGESKTTGSNAAATVSPSTAAVATANADKKITMGFAQVGAESGWRSANTKSITILPAKCAITGRTSFVVEIRTAKILRERTCHGGSPIRQRHRTACDSWIKPSFPGNNPAI